MGEYKTEAVDTPFVLQEVAFGSVISTGSANSITMQWPKTPRNGHCSNTMGQVGCAALHKGLHSGKPALFEGVPGCVDACCEVQVGHLHPSHNDMVPNVAKHVTFSALPNAVISMLDATLYILLMMTAVAKACTSKASWRFWLNFYVIETRYCTCCSWHP
jgi:hypothetical protein